MKESRKGAWRIACLIGLVLAVAFFFTLGREPVKLALNQIRQWGPAPFFGVFAFCISFGVPPTPFLLAAGAAFGIGTNLVGLLFAYSVSLAVSYGYANRLFKAAAQGFLERRAPQLADCFVEHPRMSVFLVRMFPGFPYVLQNCLLAAMCRSFSTYFAASLASILLVAPLYVLAGRSAVDRNLLVLVPVALLLVSVGLLGRQLKGKSARRKVGASLP